MSDEARESKVDLRPTGDAPGGQTGAEPDFRHAGPDQRAAGMTSSAATGPGGRTRTETAPSPGNVVAEDQGRSADAAACATGPEAGWQRAEIDSPCQKICVVHPEARICVGCYRTTEEIRIWSRLDPAERRRIMDELPGRAGMLRRRRGGRTGRSGAGRGGRMKGGGGA